MWNWQMTESKTGLFWIQNPTHALNFFQMLHCNWSLCWMRTLSFPLEITPYSPYCHCPVQLALLLTELMSNKFHPVLCTALHNCEESYPDYKKNYPPHLYGPVYSILFPGDSLHICKLVFLLLSGITHLFIPCMCTQTNTNFIGPAFVGKTQNKFELHRSLF